MIKRKELFFVFFSNIHYADLDSNCGTLTILPQIIRSHVMVI